MVAGGQRCQQLGEQTQVDQHEDGLKPAFEQRRKRQRQQERQRLQRRGQGGRDEGEQAGDRSTPVIARWPQGAHSNDIIT